MKFTKCLLIALCVALGQGYSLAAEKTEKAGKTEKGQTKQEKPAREPICKTITKCTTKSKCPPGTAQPEADRGACVVESRECTTEEICQ